jgi:uncharacterized iron-regulated membrane protein
MVALVLGLLGFLLFVAMVAGLYVWARRTEADAIYEPREKSEDLANALRLGIALTGPSSTSPGR